MQCPFPNITVFGLLSDSNKFFPTLPCFFSNHRLNFISSVYSVYSVYSVFFVPSVVP
ncbi:hypothetical protein EVA_20309 [gut metagenome]|uniref:Uncharacterized protein n=1 Tax=gut metagenome TaxID=749906 RepID=J9BVL7_9ZZZZ